jgi:hypothetical protein
MRWALCANYTGNEGLDAVGFIGGNKRKMWREPQVIRAGIGHKQVFPY